MDSANGERANKISLEAPWFLVADNVNG
jgi:hypothetical protein